MKPSFRILMYKSANVITKCPQIDVHIIYTETCGKKLVKKILASLKIFKICGNKLHKST